MFLTSKTGVGVVRTSPLRVHHLQLCCCQQQSIPNSGCQPYLSWCGRRDRSCFVHFIVQANAADCNLEPAQQVRYKGVCTSLTRRPTSQIVVKGKGRHLGTYTSPEEAARVYDEARILLGKDPVNFPRSEYDEAAILHFPDFDTFAKQKKAASRLKTKASKFIGVTLNISGRWVSRGPIEGRSRSNAVHIGVFPTEELAAQAYDKFLLYQGLDTKNFPKASYDLQTILMHETIDSLMTSIRAEAKALKSTDYTSRYFGVYKSHNSKIQRNFPYEAGFYLPNDQRVHLGCYETEEQAAVSVDRCCIYRGRKPVNYPDHPYDKQEICRPARFVDFVQHSREQAARLVKAQQTSRFNGVSWDRRQSQWEAYVSVRRRKMSLGLFDNEQAAARAVDERRKSLGQEAVNFPLKSSYTLASDSLWLKSAMIGAEHGRSN